MTATRAEVASRAGFIKLCLCNLNARPSRRGLLPTCPVFCVSAVIAGAQSTRSVSLPVDIQKVKSGTLTKCTPSSKVDSSQEGKASEGTGSQCFFTAVNPMYAPEDLEGVECDLDKPRIVP